ncbi:hypothetical protein Mapa_017408 [Marchantia paleacea]|nr:hypothetical protein Mapa_017408 [Marchantia paleacea]
MTRGACARQRGGYGHPWAEMVCVICRSHGQAAWNVPTLQESASLQEPVSNSAKRQLTGEVSSSQKPSVASSDHFDTSTESGNSGDQNTSEETSSGGGFPGVLAAGMGASFLLSCALVCPCWKPTRKKDDVSQTFGTDISSKTGR